MTYKLSSIIIATIAILPVWADVQAPESFFPEDITWTEYRTNTASGPSFSNVNAHITNATSEDTNKYFENLRFSNIDYAWFESGIVAYEGKLSQSTGSKGDFYGAKKVTVIGNKNANNNDLKVTGTIRGAWFTGDSSIMAVYSGTFYNKVSAVMTNTIGNESTKNGVANMYIFGGSYKSDITGIGMQNTGTNYINTNIEVYGGTINDGFGIFGGTSGSGTEYEEKSNLIGNTNVVVGNGANITYVAGGNRKSGDITGNTNVLIKDGANVGGVLGGSSMVDSVNANTLNTITGNTNVTISNANVGIIESGVSTISGVIGGGVNTTITGTSTVSINGDNTKIKGGIIGGSIGWNTTTIGNIVLNISGGTIDATGSASYASRSVNNQIYGGGLAIGVAGLLSTTASSSQTINNGTQINITGGNITGNIFGGSYAIGEKYSGFLVNKTSTATATVNGGTAITVDVKNDISIAGNIYGGGNQGSNGTSVVNGGTNVVFSNNDGKTLTFTGTVSGNGLNGAVVNGTKVFSFDNYNGAFGGTIENFDIVNIKTSNLTGNINLSSTASNVFVYGVSSIDSIINGMTSITIDKDAVFTIENSSLLDGVNLVNNGQLIIKNYDSEAGVEVKGELVVDESLSLDIGTETSAVVKSVENVTETFVEDFANSFVGESTSEFKAAAFDFDIVLEQGESVTLSFFVGDSALNAENFTIFHEQNGEWSQAEDVSNVKYEDGVLSFDVSHFSGYGYIATAVPEPAEWAMLLGSLALALAVYRRRK